MRSITHLVVHCSATPPALDVGVKEIRRWHVEGNGWDDVGYHYVIRRDGLVEEGRPVEQVGAHVSGHNASTIGICMVGGIAADSTPQNNFNSRQFDALYALLLTLHHKFPGAEVLGHRDFPGVAKACPCFDVRDWCKSRALKPDFSNVVSGVTTTAPKE
jgi:N-acetylmuramoyl-L-alanine amidase